MNHSTKIASSFIAAACMTFFTAAASAQAPAAQDLQRVEVTGQTHPQAPRTDVRAVCPSVVTELQDELSGVWQTVEEPGTVRVQFRLQGGHISEVKTKASSQAYRSAVKRAVHTLDCVNNNDKEQLFTFAVQFKSPDALRPQGAVALMTP